jgi:hypothetical protein
MSKWHGGKGSNPRPIGDRKQFEDNWDKIFSKKSEKNDKSLILNEKKIEKNEKKG